MISLLLALISFPAFAKETTLICQGRELAAGQAGRMGEIGIMVALGAPVRGEKPVVTGLHVRWAGDRGSFIAPGMVCGRALQAGTACTTATLSTGGGGNLIRQSCGVGEFGAGGVRKIGAESSVVLNSDASHGRITCRAPGTRLTTIEIANCR